MPVVNSPTLSNKSCGLPWRTAAPSCVYPAGVAENCDLLAPFFDEIALAFFETDACLAYTRQDVPDSLTKLPVGWHMHLPLDLPWAAGTARVAEVALALARSVRFLSPRAFVLHPPAVPEQLAELAALLRQGGMAPQSLLVENIQGRDLEQLWPVIADADLGVCLDLGHMLVHGQEDFLTLPGLEARLSMVHLNAPDPEKPARHASLALLDAHGLAVMDRLLSLLAPGRVAVLELFGEAALFESLELLRAASARMGGRRP
ncbi:hypothetical protein SAMN04488503_1062 [Humidesulfovibrio mexicanus]|uniref:Sugar phosphate isomerase/epimerase n=1 Tax=Humidesulfovibrio mexicanus TaxID=147047 RepID=A0A238YY49_9BACT|nr:cobamide remodeling phosphodiesterase CbiR [Humidesulfovibrio mexicanus]SNR75638.1 hypothetical protein SAMN04488503_1062 [Humidesulfovibrio mexicanus]